MKPGFITLLMTLIMMTLTACEAGGGQDIIVEMEVTRLVVVTATPDSSSTAESQPSGPLPINSPEAVATTVIESPTPGPTATPDVFPTPIVGEILIAEQTFQNGKMFWLEPIDQVWIITTDEEGQQIWINRDDNFEEGMVENDPALTPPASGLMQPIRGFGMLWRDDPELQSLLGWATGDEFGYSTNYEYHWGGTVNADNVYEPGPGYHLIQTLNRNVYRFDDETRTWEIIRQEE